MKTTLASLFVIIAVQASAQFTRDFTLPSKWEKDFTITLSFGGSMDGSNSSVRFTYDSCIYKRNVGMKAPKTTIYLLKDADRVAILKKLHELKMDKVKSEMSMHPVHDGWSTSICFGMHCISGGTSYELSDTDKDIFSTAYSYLEQFAIDNAKKVVKQR